MSKAGPQFALIRRAGLRTSLYVKPEGANKSGKRGRFYVSKALLEGMGYPTHVQVFRLDDDSQALFALRPAAKTDEGAIYLSKAGNSGDYKFFWLTEIADDLTVRHGAHYDEKSDLWILTPKTEESN